jgi:hypothetical protein
MCSSHVVWIVFPFCHVPVQKNIKVCLKLWTTVPETHTHTQLETLYEINLYLYVSSTGWKDSERNVRTLKVISGMDSLQFFWNPERFSWNPETVPNGRAISAKVNSMTLKLMTNQLRDIWEMIWQVLPKNFGQLKIWAKFEPHTWPGVSPPFSVPWNKICRQRNSISIRRWHQDKCNKVKVKQSRYRPGAAQSYRKLRFPDYMTTAQDGGKVVSLKHWPPLPPVNAPGTHFC